jgi:hypothetical protein
MITVRKDPLPAPCADCGVVIEWPSPFAFVAFGVAHLACVEARDDKRCDNCQKPSGGAYYCRACCECRAREAARGALTGPFGP